MKTEWIHCLDCDNKIRDRIREDTILNTILFTIQSAGERH